jgi:polar amino acid transport system permease protein
VHAGAGRLRSPHPKEPSRISPWRQPADRRRLGARRFARPLDAHGHGSALAPRLLPAGFPALQLEGVPIDPFFWGIVAIILVYSAYVAEVYRAGIESVHPSQDAAARSLGLSRLGSLRHVVVPQAVRRVVPPLLNDFIGLQKDTALLGMIGVVEAFRQAQLEQSATFNFTPFVALALVFVVFTIPLTRLTDWLIARERRRRQAGALL